MLRGFENSFSSNITISLAKKGRSSGGRATTVVWSADCSRSEMEAHCLVDELTPVIPNLEPLTVSDVERLRIV